MASHGNVTNGTNGMASASLSVNAQEFIPRNFLQDSRSDYNESINEIHHAIMDLLNNPEKFYQVANPLTQFLDHSITDDETVAAVVEEIFQMSLFESNFRYTGARLCSFLSEHLTTSPASNFRKSLLKRCQLEHNKREELMTPKDLYQLMGYTLFIGELMLNLTVQGKVMTVFPRAIHELLSCLLTIHNNDTVKCAVQVLKLTGASLDSQPDYKAKMDATFSAMKNLIAAEDTPKLQRLMLLQVVEMRAKEWQDGTDVPPNVTAAPVDATSNQFSDPVSAVEAVFYGDHENGEPNVVYDFSGEGYGDGEYDGVYEPWAAAEDNYEVVYDGDTPYVIEGDMDPEMLEAYEQFVAENEQLHHS